MQLLLRVQQQLLCVPGQQRVLQYSSTCCTDLPDGIELQHVIHVAL